MSGERRAQCCLALLPPRNTTQPGQVTYWRRSSSSYTTVAMTPSMCTIWPMYLPTTTRALEGKCYEHHAPRKSTSALPCLASAGSVPHDHDPLANHICGLVCRYVFPGSTACAQKQPQKVKHCSRVALLARSTIHTKRCTTHLRVMVCMPTQAPPEGTADCQATHIPVARSQQTSLESLTGHTCGAPNTHPAAAFEPS